MDLFHGGMIHGKTHGSICKSYYCEYMILFLSSHLRLVTTHESKKTGHMLQMLYARIHILCMISYF